MADTSSAWPGLGTKHTARPQPTIPRALLEKANVLTRFKTIAKFSWKARFSQHSDYSNNPTASSRTTYSHVETFPPPVDPDTDWVLAILTNEETKTPLHGRLIKYAHCRGEPSLSTVYFKFSPDAIETLKEMHQKICTGPILCLLCHSIDQNLELFVFATWEGAMDKKHRNLRQGESEFARIAALATIDMVRSSELSGPLWQDRYDWWAAGIHRASHRSNPARLDFVHCARHE